jgi:dTDP-4-dehydrorhamnose reductase
MRVAVTGARGRLGRALVEALADAPYTGPGGPLAWDRAAFDLDAPEGVPHRSRPAWSSSMPRRDRRRLRPRPGALAFRRTPPRRCWPQPARPGVELLVISTNEVFDGTRMDGLGYGPDAPVSPGNPYGASKAAAERLATGRTRRRPVSRSGSPGRRGCSGHRGATSAGFDAAERAGAELLRVVSDEWGTPTYTTDVAAAIVELLSEDAIGGIHHLVNGLFATRADWARYTIARAGLEVDIRDVPSSTWERPSRPPRWGVLEPTRLPSGEPLRVWPDAMADYAPTLLRARRGGVRA